MNEEIKIKRKANDFHMYDYELNDGKNIFQILFGGTLDLYFVLRTKNEIPYEGKTNIDFIISKDNYELYSLFDTLYNDVINIRLYDEERLNHGYKRRREYKSLVSKDKKITWMSDDEPDNIADRVVISKEEDSYKLTFRRVESTNDPQYFRSGYSITIRFRNSGSRYEPFNIAFMKLYRDVQSIDPDYHQIDIEEVAYNQKVLSKKR